MGRDVLSFSPRGHSFSSKAFEIESRKGPMRFEFEEVFGPESKQGELYARFGPTLLDCSTSGVT